MTPEQIDPSFVPQPVDGLLAVPVGDEVVLLDGWRVAIVLNPTGALIWDCLDGVRSLGQVASDLASEASVERDRVLDIVVGFARKLGEVDLLDGVALPVGDTVQLVPIPQLSVGDTFDDVELPGLDGSTGSLRDRAAGGEVLAVNWNPNCGYCVSIAARLAALESSLDAAGVTMLLIAFGDADANRRVVEQAGITAPILLLGNADSPFGNVGTPSTAHLDADLGVRSLAYGNVEVPDLAAKLAGVKAGDSGEGSAARAGRAPRYLLEQDGLCAPGTGTGTMWSDTRVYRIGDYHVGIRVDTASTASVLDELFEHRAVEDSRAGHSYSVALPATAYHPGTDTDSTGTEAAAGLNLLVQPARTTVRSRDPARVLRALLGDLHDRIAEFEHADARLRVNAIAVQVGSGAGLIPVNFHAFAPRLQSLLARRGVALADAPHPEIDLRTTELVIPEPAVAHSPAVLDRVAVDLTGRSELPAVLPGRYPLLGWCVIHPGEHTFVRLSAAQAAAATVSSLVEADDPVERVRQFGDLFLEVPAFGLWYYSDTEVADLIAQALGA